jgi:N-acetylneuraminate synthase
MSATRPLIIAEAGVNHNGSLDLALELVDAAAEAGADVVKFQTFRSDLLVTTGAPKAAYQVRQTGAQKSQAEMLEALELGEQAFRRILMRCTEKRIEFLSTPFDEDSVGMLVERLGVKRLKVSSGDATNGPLLLRMAQTGLPVILSTGMCSMDEIREALGVLACGYLGETPSSRNAIRQMFGGEASQRALRDKVTVLHCTTDYPTALEDVNLLAMDTIADALGLPVGYSDHTNGITVPIAAVARGACVIEKHFTLDRTMSGPDHAASLEPGELRAMVQAIDEVARCLGSRDKKPAASERRNAAVARRALFARVPINAGELLSSQNIAVRRPASGRSPMEYWDIVGKPATRGYTKDDAID